MALGGGEMVLASRHSCHSAAIAMVARVPVQASAGGGAARWGSAADQDILISLFSPVRICPCGVIVCKRCDETEPGLMVPAA